MYTSVGQTLNVRNITQALRDVNQWHSLGVALGIAGHKLEAIGLDNPNQTQRCKVSRVTVECAVCFIQKREELIT